MPDKFTYSSPTRTIKEWMGGFSELYFKHDKNRSPEEIWLSVMGYCSQVGEGIRRNNYHDCLKAATHLFCWLCSYVSVCINLENDPLFKVNGMCLSQIVGLKFPQRCGHCGESPCSCDPVSMDEKQNKAGRYTDLFKRGDSTDFDLWDINRWMNEFWDIYKRQIHILSLETLGFHMLEEAGEEATAIRQLSQLRGILKINISGIDDAFLKRISDKKTLLEEYVNIQSICPNPDYSKEDSANIKSRIIKAKMDQFIELADTFSWFCSVLIKIYNNIENTKKISPSEFHLEKYLIDEYLPNKNASADITKEPLECPTCHNVSCSCKFFPFTNLSASEKPMSDNPIVKPYQAKPE